MKEIMAKMLIDKKSRSLEAAEDLSVKYAEEVMIYWVGK